MLFFLVSTIVVGVGIFKLLQSIRVGKRAPFNDKQLFNRPLGLIERWYAAFEPPRMFTQALFVEGNPPDLIKTIEIVKVLCARFPILTASLKYSPTLDASLVQLDMPNGVDFPVRVEKKTKEEWEKEITKEMNKFFTPRIPDTPLWRMNILFESSSSSLSSSSPFSPPLSSSPPRFCIVVTFHHLIADGISGTIFLKNFIQIHNDLQAGRVPNKEEIKSPLLEDVVDVRPTLTHLLYEVFHAFSPIKKPRQDYLGPPEKNTTLSTIAYYLKVKEDVLVPLREICKKERVTLHGALSAALMFATQFTINSLNQKEEDTELSFTFPVSLRKYVQNTNANFMGLILCGATMNNIIINKDNDNNKFSLFWNFARRVNAETDCLQRSAVAKVGMLNFVPGTLDNFVNVQKTKGLPNHREASTELSNLGVVDFSSFSSSSDSWKAQELYFGIPNHIAGPVFCNSCATVGNTLTLMTTIPAPVIPVEAGETLQKTFYYCLLSAIQNPSFSFANLS